MGVITIEAKMAGTCAPHYGYTVVYVKDVSKSVDFYSKAFGLTVRRLDHSRRWGELESGSTTIAFTPIEQHEMQITEQGEEHDRMIFRGTNWNYVSHILTLILLSSVQWREELQWWQNQKRKSGVRKWVMLVTLMVMLYVWEAWLWNPNIDIFS